MAKYSVKQGGVGNQVLGVGGIDVAKDWHYVQWLDQNGRPVGKALRFANTRAGFEAMWDRRPSDAVRIGMESTGHYWLGLAHWLRAHGAEVVLVQPAHVHRLKELDDTIPRPRRTPKTPGSSPDSSLMTGGSVGSPARVP